MTVGLGSRLGSYEIGELAGRGGMGEVYRARDTILKRTVAIKILPADFADDTDRLRRLQTEAETLAAVNHPNISSIHALEEADGIRFLVLEFVEGETLADRLRHGAIPERELLPIARQVCAALAAAHDRGIVHRDLKPANIKLTPDGTVKLLDFGLARMFGSGDSDRDLSRSPTMTTGGQGVIAGTAAYMAPEQARGRAVDKRADLWALGCVLYEMLGGEPAFSGDTVTDILAAVVTREPPRAAIDQASPQLRWLIDRCLQKDPAARFRDAADAGALLGAEMPPAATSIPRRRLTLTIAAAVIAAAVGAALAVAALRRAPVHPKLARFDIPVSNAPIAQPMAVSPDGQRIAYVVTSAGGRIGLWQRSLDTLETKPIQGADSIRTIMSPEWSPDSRSLAFVADGKLKRIDVRGGSPEVIASLDSQIGGLSWGGDDVLLLASNNHGLRRVAATGGAISEVTTRDASLDELYHDCPQFLPDNRHFIYLAYSDKKPENRAVYAGSLDSTARTRLMTSDTCVSDAAPGYLLFARGLTLLARPFDAASLRFTGDEVTVTDSIATYSNGEMAAFAVSAGGTLVYRTASRPDSERLIVWMTRAGRASEPLGAPIQPGVGGRVRLSNDGRRVVFATGTDGGRDDIWVHDLDRNLRVRLTTDPDVDHIPIWSPDGSRIAFDSHRSGRGSALYEIPSNGAAAERVLLKVEGTDFIAASDWSRDGRSLVYMRSPTGTAPWNLWVLPLGAGGPAPFAYRPSSADQSNAALSPNGRWLAYSTNESGSYQVVVQPFPDPSGGKWQVSTGGGAHPAWRRDGRELYYLAPSGDVVAVSVTTEPAFSLGEAAPLFRIGGDTSAQGGASFDAAADGSRFIVLVPARTAPPPLTAVLNWWAPLKPN